MAISGAAVVVAVIGVFAWGRADHGDAGPLVSVGLAADEAGGPARIGGVVTYGVPDIRNVGKAAVTLDGIQLLGRSPGLHVIAVEVASGTGEQVGVEQGSPDVVVPHTRTLHPLRGFVLRPQRYVQLIVAVRVERRAPVWFRGFRLAYRDGSGVRDVVGRHAFVTCGIPIGAPMVACPDPGIRPVPS